MQTTLLIYWGLKHVELAGFSGKKERVIKSAFGTSPAETFENVLAQLDMGRRCHKAVLIVPRSEVIQKRIVLQADGAESIAMQIERMLPHTGEAVAYGIALEAAPSEKNSREGTLCAMPERKVRGLLETLSSLGLSVDDVLCEDQVLVWKCQPVMGKLPTVLIHSNQERFLFVLAEQEHLLYSRAFPSASLESSWSDFGLNLRESGIEPAAIVIAGEFSKEERVILENKLKIPIMAVDERASETGATFLMGVKQRKNFGLMNLLPADLKIIRQEKKYSSLLRQCWIALSCFMAACLLAAIIHIQFLRYDYTSFHSKAGILASQVRKTKTQYLKIQHIEVSQQNKARVLALIYDLSEHIPSSVRLRKIAGDKKGISLEGNAPTQSLLADTIKRLELSKTLTGLKLEHTRVRKKFNENYLEFEVSALWKR